jgi:tetratricopeptide (TPR) repeat protein
VTPKKAIGGPEGDAPVGGTAPRAHPRPRPRSRSASSKAQPHHRRPTPTWLVPVVIGVVLAVAAAAVYWFAYAGPIRGGLSASRSFYVRGEYAQAKAALDQVFARDAEQIEAVLQLARIEAATGDSPGALAHYAQVIERRPNDAVVHYELASLERLLGNTAGAVPNFEAALRLVPEEARYLDALTKAYIATGKARDAATLLLERADDTARPDAERTALYVKAAAAFIEARADADAKAALTKALKLAPGDPAVTRMLDQLK